MVRCPLSSCAASSSRRDSGSCGQGLERGSICVPVKVCVYCWAFTVRERLNTQWEDKTGCDCFDCLNISL